jgi:hypothetical protein
MNMKKKLLLFVISLLPLVASAFSGEMEIDGIRYFIATKAKTAEVLANNYSGEIVIPATVECEDIVCNVISINNDAFYGCSSLKSIVIKAITPPILGSSAFDGSTCSIYVPDESVEVYKDASTFWKVFKDRIKPISEKPNYP